MRARRILSLMVLLGHGAFVLAQGFEVGVVRDGPGTSDEAKVIAVQREWKTLQGAEDPVVWRSDDAFIGRHTTESVTDALRAALADPSVQVILLTGPLGQFVAVQPGVELTKPVLVAGLDKVDFASDLVTPEGFSAKRNLVITVMPGGLRRELETFHELTGARTISLLVGERLLRENHRAVAWARAFSEGLPFEVDFFPASSDPQSTLTALAARRPSALVITRYLDFNPEERRTLFTGLRQLGIPSFSSARREDVREGVMAGMMPDVEGRLLRRVAVQLLRLVEGTDPARMRVLFPVDQRLAVNVLTAAQCGVDLPLRVFVEAELFDREAVRSGDPIDLPGAMRLAAAGNPDLRIARASSLAARASGDLARSALLPRVGADVSSSFQSDNAARILGRPERVTRAGLEVRQIIFSDPLIQAYLGAVDSARAADFEAEAVRLDLLAAGGAAFLDYLASRHLLRIDTANLELIRSNLAIARSRLAAGEADQSETLRWEAEEARGRALVQQREAAAEAARVRMNRVLGVQLGARWEPSDVALADGEMGFLNNHLVTLIRDVRQLRRFGVFTVVRALEGEPTLRALDELITAGQRGVGVERRRFFLPEVSAALRVDRELEGDYVPPVRRPADLDRTSWSAVLQASLPLFEGGGRFSRVSIRKAELEQIVARREAAARRVEGRAMEALFNLEGSWPAIELNRTAVLRARRALDLVREQYSAGTIGLVDVLDAQRQTLEAERAAVLTLFTYLGDLLEFQRAISWFEVDRTVEEHAAWITDLENVLSQWEETP